MYLKILKYIIISLLPLTLYLSYIFVYNFSNNSHYNILKDRLKWTIKDTITSNKELKFWKNEYQVNTKKIEDLKITMLKKDYLLAEVPNLIGKIPIKKNVIEKYELKNSNFLLEKFKTNYLTTSKHPGALGSSYIEYHNNNLFLISGNGIIGYTSIENFNFEKAFNFQLIESNIKDLIKDDSFYKNSEVGVKDALIYDNKIYLSYTKLEKPEDECYNTSILVSEINTQNLKFEEFFNPIDCVKRNNEYGDFTAVQSGGRMFAIDEHNIFFTTGDFRYRDHAQNPENIFGSLQKINLKTKKNELVAYGLRNSQGLYFDKTNQMIILTDHGPLGGDEINVKKYIENKTYNFGWPISSYGEHYGLKGRDEDHPLYKKAPLYKSHKDYGFEEPLKYFTPSIGISQITKLPKKFIENKDEKINFLYGSLGNNPEEGDMSIQLITLDKNFEEQNNQVFNIKERVRDIIYINDLNKVFLMFETSASIGVLSKI